MPDRKSRSSCLISPAPSFGSSLLSLSLPLLLLCLFLGLEDRTRLFLPWTESLAVCTWSDTEIIEALCAAVHVVPAVFRGHMRWGEARTTSYASGVGGTEWAGLGSRWTSIGYRARLLRLR
ncbi:hypothetical protein BDN67DRAFT_366155 [Paxillus ammoniavirescens]|nr:hypothetical protein BDN67DRAFT_366155 [Paxillus ammoniavirescens]